MVPHALVDVQVRGRGRVEPRQQLVHHYQQLHLRRVVHKQPLYPLLELLRRLLAQHLLVGFVLLQFRRGRARAQPLPLGVADVRLVARHNRAAGEVVGHKQLVVLAGLVNAARHQHGIAAPAVQPGLQRHVLDNILDDDFQPPLRAEHLLHGAPLLLQGRAGVLVQARRLGIKPLVYLVRGPDVLLNVARLVAQVQHHAVAHGRPHLVLVNVAPEGFQGRFLVGFQQGRPREADERRARAQQLFHGVVQLARLRAVALVHHHPDFALGPKLPAAQARRQLAQVFLVPGLVLAPPKLVYQRAQ